MKQKWVIGINVLFGAVNDVIYIISEIITILSYMINIDNYAGKMISGDKCVPKFQAFALKLKGKLRKKCQPGNYSY